MWWLTMFLLACRSVGTESDADVDVPVDADEDGVWPPDDCDDGDVTVYPGANEVVGDGIDQSCDGGEICFSDFDADGYRADATITSEDADCSDPGEAERDAPAGDCADGDAARNPAAQEVCDGGDVDDDCDDLIDEEDPGAVGC